MADTIRGIFSGSCSDCGSNDCFIQHWGPLVPLGKYGNFCVKCWLARVEDSNAGKEPRQFGLQKEKSC